VSCILLLALKYIPGMHLRVSEEAEMMGLDLDQFFDEQIGDWESFQPMDKITHGVIREEQIAGVEEGLSSGSGHSVQREAVNAEEKKD
jgi:Amt family ammonium transporter